MCVELLTHVTTVIINPNDFLWQQWTLQEREWERERVPTFSLSLSLFHPPPSTFPSLSLSSPLYISLSLSFSIIIYHWLLCSSQMYLFSYMCFYFRPEIIRYRKYFVRLTCFWSCCGKFDTRTERKIQQQKIKFAGFYTLEIHELITTEIQHLMKVGDRI